MDTASNPKEIITLDAVSALVNLGYPKNLAEKTVEKCIKILGDGNWRLEEIIKKALELQA